MKTWIRRTLLGALSAVLALGALTGCGHTRSHAGWSVATPEERARQQDWLVERATRRLDLTPEQQAKLRALVVVLQAERAAFAGEPHPRVQARALLAGDKFDRAGAQALAQKAANAVATRSPAVIAVFGDFYDSLAPGQQAKLREMMDRRRGWRRRG